MKNAKFSLLCNWRRSFRGTNSRAAPIWCVGGWCQHKFELSKRSVSVRVLYELLKKPTFCELWYEGRQMLLPKRHAVNQSCVEEKVGFNPRTTGNCNSLGRRKILQNWIIANQFCGIFNSVGAKKIFKWAISTWRLPFTRTKLTEL